MMSTDILSIGMYEADKNVIKYKFCVKNGAYVPSLASEKLEEKNYGLQIYIWRSLLWIISYNKIQKNSGGAAVSKTPETMYENGEAFVKELAAFSVVEMGNAAFYPAHKAQFA